MRTSACAASARLAPAVATTFSYSCDRASQIAFDLRLLLRRLHLHIRAACRLCVQHRASPERQDRHTNGHCGFHGASICRRLGRARRPSIDPLSSVCQPFAIEPVAEAAQRHEIARPIGIRLDLLAQVGHLVVDDAVGDVRAESPDFVEQLRRVSGRDPTCLTNAASSLNSSADSSTRLAVRVAVRNATKSSSASPKR